MRTKPRPNYVQGALAGLIGGLVGAFAMNRFQAAAINLKGGGQRQEERESGGRPGSTQPAVTIAETLDQELHPQQKGPAGNSIHYLVGAAAGGFYGILVEKLPAGRAGFGALFGGGLWLLSDGIAVPLFGLSTMGTHSFSRHAFSLASHLVFGGAAECVRRGMRSL